MSRDLEIIAVNLSEQKGTVKRPVERAEVDSFGLQGDAHAGPGTRQVSLLGEESIARLAARMGRTIGPGEFGENITLRGLDLRNVAMLDRLRFGDVELQVTQIGKECHGARCAIFREVGQCVMPVDGIFTRVMHGGCLAAGDRGEHLPRTLRFKIVTLSDRAAAGQYEDHSGPRIRELLEDWLAGTRWHPRIDSKFLPDDAGQLRAELLSAIAAGADVIFTTGGTGVGPRDITPETVATVCERVIPGIMENIRLKFGSQKPNALLSRSIAGVTGTTQIYTLPGNVKAVEEYLGEIRKTMEHLTFMLHGLDIHPPKHPCPK